MEIITNFLNTVIAGVTIYYICRWLDNKNKGNKK